MNELETQVRDVLTAYETAVGARDVEAFLALYDEDIHLFDAWDRFERVGANVWREMVTDWFGSHPEGTLEAGFDELQVVAGETVAFVHAALSFAVIVDGERMHEQLNRYTAGLELRDGVWKIIHEHTSIPVRYETGTGIYSR